MNPGTDAVTNTPQYDFAPRPDRCTKSVTTVLCLVAIALGIAVRLVWIGWAADIESMQWQGRLQPTTHDAYYHGAVILRHAESGMEGVPLVPDLLNRQGLLHVLGFGTRVFLPVHTDSILLWMPVLLSGLLAIPVLLIGRALGSTWWGFGAAVLSVVAVNYFERTMAGYFDTDMFIYTWAAMIAWLLIEADRRADQAWTLAGALFIFLLPFVYASALSLGIAFAGLWILLRLIRFPRDEFTWSAVCVIGLAAALSPLSHGTLIAQQPLAWIGALAAIVILWSLLRRSVPPWWLVAAGGCAAAVIFIMLMPWSDFISLVDFYVRSGGDSMQVGSTENGVFDEINFRAIHPEFILETQVISLPELGWRLLGSPITAVIALIGYVLACIRRPMMLMLLPLVAFGALALTGGLRFVTWAVVPASLGAAWVAFAVSNLLLAQLRSPASAITGLALILVAIMAVPNIIHDVQLRSRPVMQYDEIDAMRVLQDASDPGDLVIAWWDYGSGVWYYARREVLVHPALTNNDLFPISRMMVTDEPGETARAGLALAGARMNGQRPAIHALLDSVEGDGAMDRYQTAITTIDHDPELAGEVFLYLPLEQIGLLESIASYSHPDLIAGEKPNLIFARLMQGMQQRSDGWFVHAPSSLAFNQNTGVAGVVQADGGIRPLNFATTSVVELTGEGPTRILRLPPATQGPWAVMNPPAGFSVERVKPGPEKQLHLLVLPQSGSCVVVNDAGLNTMTIQMGVLGRFDPHLFEPIFLGPRSRIYRVRHESM